MLRPLRLLDIHKNCGISDKVMIVYRKSGSVSLLLNFFTVRYGQDFLVSCKIIA